MNIGQGCKMHNIQINEETVCQFIYIYIIICNNKQRGCPTTELNMNSRIVKTDRL